MSTDLSGRPTRRQFLSRALAATAGCTVVLPEWAGGRSRLAEDEKLNVAFVGIGNRGADLIKTFAASGLVNIVAFCDIDLLAAHTAETRKQLVHGLQCIRRLPNGSDLIKIKGYLNAYAYRIHEHPHQRRKHSWYK